MAKPCNFCAILASESAIRIKRFDDLEEMITYIQAYEARRHDLDFEIDGLVIKLDDNTPTTRSASWERIRVERWPINSTRKRSRRASSRQQQTWPDRRITPGAELEPVFVSGATISRQRWRITRTLHVKTYGSGNRVTIKRAVR